MTKVAHVFWWHHNNQKQLGSAREHLCDVTCDIPYYGVLLIGRVLRLRLYIFIAMKQNRSTEECSKTWQVQERTVSILEQMQVPNGAGPGVRRSKRPLLASRTRCNVLWKPPKFGNKVKIGNKVQFGNKFAIKCNVWSIEGVIVYGHVPECHVTFGRGRLHNLWWDPHIDHKTSWRTISNVPWHIPVRGA